MVHTLLTSSAAAAKVSLVPHSKTVGFIILVYIVMR
jgi:hypothetical protein